MDTYLWLKALHIASVVAWIGGMLTLGVVYRLVLPVGSATAERMTLIRQVLRWDRVVTQPALGGVWLFGIAIAVMGHWFATGWLGVKLLIVIFLSALHGIQSARLRRYADDPTRVPPAWLRNSGPITLVCMLIIVVLVVTKLF